MDGANSKDHRTGQPVNSTCPGCGQPWHAPGRLGAAVRAIDHYPATAAILPAHVVYALDRWSSGRSPVLAAEARHRAALRTIALERTRP